MRKRHTKGNRVFMNLQEFYNKYGRDIDFVAPGKREGYVNGDWLHLYDLIWHYKNEMIQWFDRQRADKENPMSCVTQEHWYSMYLEKKRLEKQGLFVHHKEYGIVPTHYKHRGDFRVTFIKYFNDGKYVVSKVAQDTKYDIRYIRDNKVAGQVVRRCNIDYYVLRSTTGKGLYVCPNCGAEMSLEKLLDGCDYCNSKFDISAYKDKVISVNRVYSRHEQRGNRAHIGHWILAFLASILLPAPFIQIFPPLILLIPIGMLVTGVLMIINVPKLSQEQDVHNHFLNILCQNNPGIVVEEFIASLDSKIKSVHFAENPQDVAAFVKCDITPYLQANRNIIRCEAGRFMIQDYRMDETFQYIKLHRGVRVLIDEGSHIKEKRGILELTLAKQRVYKHKSDISMFTCQHCGATISLVEGGVCKYCGTMMDYDAYDWVIIDYRIVE